MKRLAIYVHHHPEGLIGDYILYCIKGLQEVVGKILFVVNGFISSDGREKLEKLGVDILVRENKGFDWSGWKAGIEYYGYEKIAQYDELLLTNNTYYGPIYPFSEMWKEMDKRDCDFWGITKHPQSHKYLEHIHSYWIVFRKKILESDSFKIYWENIKIHSCYKEMVENGEAQLTQYFKKKGFIPDVYVNFEKYKYLLNGDPILLSDQMVLEDNCPIIKRKYFLLRRTSCIADLVLSYRPSQFLETLQERKLFDINLIWNDLLENQTLSEINDNLNLNFILSSENLAGMESFSCKAALICLIGREDMVDYCFSYLKNLPQFVDIYIVTVSDKIKTTCLNLLKNIPNKSEVRIQINRGRDNAALFVTCKDVIEKYDYLCLVHSKRSAHISPANQGIEFCNHNYLSLLWNRAYIINLLIQFEKNTRLGMLIPYVYQARNYRMFGGNEWGGNYKNALSFFQKYLKRQPIELDPFVMAPFGGMFWCRTKALKTLSSYPWNYDDFPEEPLSKTDGLLTHCIERLFCICAQLDGFYSAYVAPDSYARSWLNNYMYLVRTIRSIYYQKENSVYSEYTLISHIQEKPQDRFIYPMKKNFRRYMYCKFLSICTFGKVKKHFKEYCKLYKKTFIKSRRV